MYSQLLGLFAILLRIPLKICSHSMYEMDQKAINAYGDELMNAGFLPIPQFGGTELCDKVRYI